MPDPFESTASGLDSPATRHFAITPADADLAIRPRALYCNVSGTVVVRDDLGTTITYNMIVGQILPIRAVQVRAASTATVIGWY